ncbi:MAG TPA: AraC family transcriptional regulator [Planctomycetota bacterium]|nr:AraC family transcriptional regulator [Planctomycetota bacterium]
MGRRLPAIEIQHLAYKEAGREYFTHHPHRHKGYQWYCVVYGKVTTTVDGHDYQLGPRDSVLIAPGALRAPRCGGPAPGYLYVVFQNRTLRLGALTGRVMAMPEELAADLHALVAEMRESPGANAGELTEALVVRLLIGLCRSAAAQGKASRAEAPALNIGYHQELVARAEAYMRSNLHRRLSRGEVAAAVHVSAPHLARIFRTTAGRGMVETLTSLRMAQAKHMLLESSMSIAQIARDVGYDSFSHFCAVFRGAVGIRPSDYRRASGHTWAKDPVAH